MTSRYDLVTMSVAMNKHAAGDTSPVTSKEVLNEAKRADLIVEIAGEIRAADEAIAAAGIDRLREVLDWRETSFNFGEFLAGQTVDLAIANRKQIRDELDAVTKKSEKLLAAARDGNPEYYNRVMKNANTANYYQGKSGDAAYWHALVDTDPFREVPDKYVDVGKAKNFNTKAALFERLNEFHGPRGEKVLDVHPETKEILNLAELQNWKEPQNNPLIASGWMSAGEVRTMLDPAQTGGNDGLSLYNKAARHNYETRKLTQQKLDEATAAVEALGEEGLDSEQILAIAKRGAGALGTIEEAAEAGGAFDFKNQEQLKEEISQFAATEKSRDRLLELQEDLARKKPSAAAVFKREMAVVLSSPSNVAWARDNGFSELGRVTIVDGKLDPNSYVPGRDDLAMVRAFNRQMERGEGRYGFKSIGTGDIVSFTLNGETMTGERLKYHAWDPAGTVRVLVPGESGHVILKPGDVDFIDVIERQPDKKSPQVKRANRRLVFQKGKIEAADKRSRAGVSEVDAAMTADGTKYFLDKSGRHVSSTELQPKIDELMAQDRVVGKVVDGNDYLVDSDGATYQVLPDGDVMELASVSESDLLDRVRSAPPRRVAVSMLGSNGQTTYRPVTSDDALTGLIDSASSDFAFEILEGEDGFDAAEEARVFDAVAEKARAAALDADRLGLTAVDTFDSTRGAKYGDVTEIAGQRFRDVNQSPTRPLESGDPVDETASMSDQNDAMVAKAILKDADLGDEPPPDLERGDPEDFPLDPVVEAATPIEDPSELTPEQQEIKRVWDAQTLIANKYDDPENYPPPPIPEGWEVVPGEGLLPKTVEEPVEPKTPDTLDDDVAASAVEAITAKPEPSTPPPVLSDEDIDVIGAPPPLPSPEKVQEFEAKRSSPKDLPPDLQAAISATPESEQVSAAVDKVAPKEDRGEVSVDRPATTSGGMSKGEVVAGMGRIKAELEKKRESEDKSEDSNETKRAKIGDVLKQLVTPNKFAEDEAAKDKKESLEALGGIFAPSDEDSTEEDKGDSEITGQPNDEASTVTSGIAPGKSGVPPTPDELAEQREENEKNAQDLMELVAARRKAGSVLEQPTSLVTQSGGE